VDLYLLDYMKIQIERAIEKYRNYRIIKKDSNEDSLTGVSNRRHLLSAIHRFKENSDLENKPFFFVLFDIDKLKKINDKYGHICGDLVLKQFALVAKNHIREYDFVARIGGDEFVGLFYNITQDVLIERLNAWKEYFSMNMVEYKENEIHTKFSFGIAKYKEDGIDFNDLMEQADKKLYEHKLVLD